LEGLNKNSQFDSENRTSDLPPSLTKHRSSLSHLFANETSSPTESLLMDVAESPLESGAESETMQATYDGKSSKR
jgi:hypothetical protein